MKDKMVKGMNLIMLDCEKATMLAIKYDVDSLSFMKKLQLKMHLMGCKLCREFARQTKVINHEVNEMKKIDPDNYKIKLTNIQKERLSETIEQNR